jgi:hypothetical protein
MIGFAIAMLLLLMAMGMESYCLSLRWELKKEINRLADASRKRQEYKRTWPRP